MITLGLPVSCGLELGAMELDESMTRVWFVMMKSDSVSCGSGRRGAGRPCLAGLNRPEAR
ncbi:hypothetical protein EMIT043CA1_40233 [Pseudomonas brassicacearum]